MATKRQLASFHNRRLKRMNRELIQMSDRWDDVDEWVSQRILDVSEQLKLLTRHINETSRGNKRGN